MESLDIPKSTSRIKLVKRVLERHLLLSLVVIALLIAALSLGIFRYFYALHGAKLENTPSTSKQAAGISAPGSHLASANSVHDSQSLDPSSHNQMVALSKPSPTSTTIPQTSEVSSCIKTVIPFTTTYKTTNSLAVGQATVSPFNDGYTIKCTGGNSSVAATNKTITVGTGGSASLPITLGMPLDQVYNLVSGPNACGPVLQATGDNNAYQLCITNVMAELNY